MPYRAETDYRLQIEPVAPADLPRRLPGAHALFIGLPGEAPVSDAALAWLHATSKAAGDGTELLLYGDPEQVLLLQAVLGPEWRYHLWFAVRTERHAQPGALLPREHRSLVLFGKNAPVLRHARLRIAYEYCPACGKTTKDYGGRKHLYDAYGTLTSDVWRDEAAPPGDALPRGIVERVANLLASDGRETLLTTVWSPEAASDAELPDRVRTAAFPPNPPRLPRGHVRERWAGQGGELVCGDALAALTDVADESVTLAFADPPYNISKRYQSYGDALELESYLRWCDAWLAEYARVLRPGGTLAVLNLPLWAARHALFLRQRLEWGGWVAWDSMSMPVRQVMPSHYALVLFRKPNGPAHVREASEHEFDDEFEFEPTRALLGRSGGGTELTAPAEELRALRPGYCRRARCVRDRVGDTEPASDLWTDVHRLKHNSRRWNHPCQLPPLFLRRLIALTTAPGERVLDAFNGIGTTTLCAQALDRRFLGIELSPEYHATARERHELLAGGGDPFAPRDRVPEVKNNRVRRQGGQAYAVPKRTLQLTVKALADQLGRPPTPEDVEQHLPHLAEYLRTYFKSWSEVLAAVRATGMREGPLEP